MSISYIPWSELFAVWLDTFIKEKEIDDDHLFEVEGESGINWIPLEIILELCKKLPEAEQRILQKQIIREDYCNRNMYDYFERIAKAIAL